MGQTIRICYADSAYDDVMRQVEENLLINNNLRNEQEAMI